MRFAGCIMLGWVTELHPCLASPVLLATNLRWLGSLSYSGCVSDSGARVLGCVSVSGFVFSYFSLPRVNLPQIRCPLSRFVRCLVCILILVASDACPVGGKAKYRNGIMPRVSCSITPLVLFAWLPIPCFLSPIPCALTPEASVLSSVCWRESERKKKRSCFLLAEGARGKSLR